jgi:cell wall-associated NlpC family hydrolase
MPKTLRDRLAEAIQRGVVNDAAIVILRRRQARQAKRSHRNHVGWKKSERKARSFPAVDSRRRYWFAKAARQKHRAKVSHERAQELISRIKERTRRKPEIQRQIKQAKEAIAKYNREHGPHITQNRPDKCLGGDTRQRVVFAAQKAVGSGWFYDQGGYWTVNYCWSAIPRQFRSDCSQWAISLYHAIGLSSPDGNYADGGYTGSIAAFCKRVSSPKPGDFVLYGTFPYHHVEVYIGNGITVGHGSAPIDHGTPGMLGGPIAFYRHPDLA